MALPAKVYVALSSGGIYYTANFDDPGGDPTWTAVNAGLASTAIGNLQLDPFAPETLQYCSANGVIYKRIGGGAWASILTTAEAQTLTGNGSVVPVWVHADTLTPGTLWVLASIAPPTVWIGTKWVLKSIDYGANWTSAALASENIYNYADGNMFGHGNYVYVTLNDATGGQSIHWSTNGGASFTRRQYGNSTMYPHGEMSPYTPEDAYGPGAGGMYRVRADTATLIYGAFNDIYGTSTPAGVMWFDPDNANHMRMLMRESVIITDDDWATYSTLSIGSGAEMAVFAPLPETTDTGLMVIGRGNNALAKIATLDNEAATTLTIRAGNNYNTPPYTNAIPSNAGGVVSNGVGTIPYASTEGPTPPPGSTITPPGGSPITLGGTAYVQAVTMPDYTGDDRGEPLPGDRGAWDISTQARAKLHAKDIRDNIDDADPTLYHLPVGADVGDAPVWDGTGYAPVDIVTQAELPHTILSAVHTDTLADTIVDGDILIGNATPKLSRLAASIPGGAGLLNVLGIVVGELRASWKALFDATHPTTNAPNDAAAEGTATTAAHRDHQHANPATWPPTDHDHSGDAGDGNTFDAANLSSGAAALGQALKADGVGGTEWGAVAGGGRYRQYTYVPDGAGSWCFVVDDDGMPIFAQLDLEP